MIRIFQTTTSTKVSMDTRKRSEVNKRVWVFAPTWKQDVRYRWFMIRNVQVRRGRWVESSELQCPMMAYASAREEI